MSATLANALQLAIDGLVFAADATEELVHVVDDPHRLRCHRLAPLSQSLRAVHWCDSGSRLELRACYDGRAIGLTVRISDAPPLG